jgi:hypothetical protein
MSTILKPYFVTLEVTAVVMAEDADHAYDVARMERRDICSDVDMSIFVGSEVKTEADLSAQDWTGDDLPYGGDDRTKLRDILAALEALPERDTKTIDMFEGQS